MDFICLNESIPYAISQLLERRIIPCIQSDNLIFDFVMKVLLIHHHPSIRTVLEKLSDAFNYELHCHSDPINAQTAYTNQSFDVMIV